jgi:hypothetical protein
MLRRKYMIKTELQQISTILKNHIHYGVVIVKYPLIQEVVFVFNI